VLRALTQGKCCYEKTWGLGVVAAVDEFDRKLVVDFEGKRAHRFALAYAAESVRPLGDSHFLALKLRDPDKFSRQVRENPAETVKAMLKEFGEMNAPRLRALMSGLVIPDKEWSSFWSSAREKLSSDPIVQMPAGRNDPIRILPDKKEFDDNWRNDFLALRVAERVLPEIESLYENCPAQSLSVEFRAAIEDRLKFVVRGMGPGQQDEVVRALLLADAAGIRPGLLLDISPYARPENLSGALNSIPARMIRPFLALLEGNSVPVTEKLIQAVPDLSSAALNEAVLYCRQCGKEEQAHAKIRALVQSGEVSLELVSWLGRNLALAAGKDICQPGTFAMTALSLLQKALARGKRKDSSQLLREIFTNSDLLMQIFNTMDEGQRLDYIRRLNSLAGLAAPDKVEIAAKIIKLFPSLAGAFSAPPVAIVQPKLTSFRSYRERQIQLEKIINEEIPRNSKEIGVARSYGDLRENYEYKAAREMQGLLMLRKAELEQMLSEARGSDFSGLPHDAAGQGTSVGLKMPDGKKLVYHILGEFDSDEKLGIISCRSKLAVALAGHRAGEAVEIPGENEAVNCLVESVSALPPEIREWINADVSAAKSS
jgi:transcription elongation GreA/GreB family factor